MSSIIYSRFMSMAVIYALIYTQIFGAFQGDNPLDLGHFLSVINPMHWVIPDAFSADTPTAVEREAALAEARAQAISAVNAADVAVALRRAALAQARADLAVAQDAGEAAQIATAEERVNEAQQALTQAQQTMFELMSQQTVFSDRWQRAKSVLDRLKARDLNAFTDDAAARQALDDATALADEASRSTNPEEAALLAAAAVTAANAVADYAGDTTDLDGEAKSLLTRANRQIVAAEADLAARPPELGPSTYRGADAFLFQPTAEETPEATPTPVPPTGVEAGAREPTEISTRPSREVIGEPEAPEGRRTITMTRDKLEWDMSGERPTPNRLSDNQVNRRYLTNKDAANMVRAGQTLYHDVHRFLTAVNAMSYGKYVSTNPNATGTPYKEAASLTTGALTRMNADEVGLVRLKEWDLSESDEATDHLARKFKNVFFPSTADSFDRKFIPPEAIRGEYEAITICPVDSGDPNLSPDPNKNYYYLILGGGCNHLTASVSDDDRGKIYSVEWYDTIIPPDTEWSTHDKAILFDITETDEGKKRIRAIDCINSATSVEDLADICPQPEFREITAVLSTDEGTIAFSRASSIIKAALGCDESRLPYALFFDAGFARHRYSDPFYWLQVKYESDDGVEVCQRPSEQSQPKQFRLVGISRNDVNYILAPVAEGAENENFRAWKNYTSFGALKRFIRSNAANFIPEGQAFQYRVDDSDIPYFVIDLNSHEQERFRQFIPGVGDEATDQILYYWTHTGLRLYEVLFNYFINSSGQSLHTSVRGVFPAMLEGRLPNDLSGNFSYPLTVKIADNIRSSTPFALFEGPHHYSGIGSEKPTYRYFDFEHWLIAGFPPLQALPEFKLGAYDGKWFYGLPNFGGGQELASTLAFQLKDSNRNRWVIRSRDLQEPQIMRGVTQIMNMLPTFYVYQTEFRVPNDRTYTTVELSLKDRNFITNDDVVELGLVPGLVKDDSGKARIDKDTGYSLSEDSYDVYPISVANRGMEQVWRAPSVKPAGFSDEFNASPQHSISNAIDQVKGIQLPDIGDKIDGEDFNFGRIYDADKDVIHQAINNYKTLATTYGGGLDISPIAIDPVANLDDDPQTFYGRLINFETQLFKGAFFSEPDTQEISTSTSEPNALIDALKNMGDALADTEGNVHVLYHQRPQGILFANEDALDPDITIRLYIAKVNINNPLGALALQSMMNAGRDNPTPLVIPPIFVPLIEQGIQSIYGSIEGELAAEVSTAALGAGGGYALHYHDVLWTSEDGTSVTGAMLSAISTRFNLLLMYLMSYYCMNDQAFNSLIDGLHNAIGGEEKYQQFVGGGVTPSTARQPQEGEEPSLEDQILQSFALFIKSIEDNKDAIMDQCTIVPYQPLTAFHFGESNVNAVCDTLVDQMGMGEKWDGLCSGATVSGHEIVNRVNDRLTAPPDVAKPQGSCQSPGEMALAALLPPPISIAYAIGEGCDAGLVIWNLVFYGIIIGVIAMIASSGDEAEEHTIIAKPPPPPPPPPEDLDLEEIEL